MGLYNFKQRFRAKVESGEKTHTIRGKRANPDKPGNTLHLYTGLRTKQAQLIFRAECLRVEEIFIRELSDGPAIAIGGIDLDDGEREILAHRDGFESFADMMKFWEGRLPFNGDVVHWKYPGKRTISEQQRTAKTQ